MRFICDRESLNLGLNNVIKGGSIKTTMPILEGILIECLKGVVKLTTNDLEVGVEYKINCNVLSEGKTVVDFKMFNEIIKKLNNEDIEIKLDENSMLIIESAGSIYKLSTMNPEEYPQLPVVNVEKSITIKQNMLKNMIKKTSFAVSMEENKPIFNGVLVEVKNNILNLVAVDGFRLALRKSGLNGNISDFSAIIPGRILNEVVKTLSDIDEQVTIGVSKNQALFELKNCKIVSRIIEGEFLNYNSVIPSDFETRIKVKTKNILDSFERVSLFSRDNSEKDKKYPVKVNISLDKVIISCMSMTGNAKEEIICVAEGKELEIGFNPKYVIDALKVIDDEEIYFEFGSSISPCIIKSTNSNEYVYMILPIRLKD